MKKTRKSLFLIFLILISILRIDILNLKIQHNNCHQKKDLLSLKTAEVDNGGGYLMDINAIFSWEEISTTGKNLTRIFEDITEYQTINFSETDWNFTFYGVEYDKIYISSYGYMSFTGEFPSDRSGIIPDVGISNNNTIAVCWFNRDSEMSGNISYLFFDDRLVIEYKDAYDGDEDYIGTFEVILYETGDIKFQYVNVLTYENFAIGLDRGDLLNYNSYIAEDEAYITSKAINFTYNQMLPFNYSVKVEKNDQTTYIIPRLDNNRLELIFGENWEENFGLLPNPKRGQKFKINITSIDRDEDYWDVNYTIWDYINRFDSFPLFPECNESLPYFKNPLNYTQPHNFTNLFPLILPSHPYFYLKNANLPDSSYNYDFYVDNIWYSAEWKFTCINYRITKIINSYPIVIYAFGYYYDNGTLRNTSISYTNGTLPIEVFQFAHVSDYYNESCALKIEENQEYEWIIIKLNSTKMELFFGSDWEQVIGVCPDPTLSQRTKVNITQISTNTTHWNITYSMWNWIDLYDNFTSPPLESSSIDYLIDPFQYQSSLVLPNKYPLFLPTDIVYYLVNGLYFDNFGFGDDDIDYEEVDGEIRLSFGYRKENKNINGYNIELYGHAEYDGNGVLSRYYLTWYNSSDGPSEIIFDFMEWNPLFQSNFTFGGKVGDNISYILLELNETLIEKVLGTNWEQSLGLPSDPTVFDKYQAEIRSIDVNQANFRVNYSIWDWTGMNNEFSGPCLEEKSISFSNNPINHTHMNLTPFLFGPNNPNFYFEYCTLNESYFDTPWFIPGINLTTMWFNLERQEGAVIFDLIAKMSYTETGFLKEFEMILNQEDEDEEVLNSTIVLYINQFFDGEKSQHLRINSSDHFTYSAKFNLLNIPPFSIGGTFEKINYTVLYVSGEDPYSHDSMILLNFTRFNNSEWSTYSIKALYCSEYISYSNFDPSYTLADFNPFFSFNFYPSIIVEVIYNNTDWVSYCQNYRHYWDCWLYNFPSNFTEFNYGFNFSLSETSYQTSSYNSAGILENFLWHNGENVLSNWTLLNIQNASSNPDQGNPGDKNDDDDGSDDDTDGNKKTSEDFKGISSFNIFILSFTVITSIFLIINRYGKKKSPILC